MAEMNLRQKIIEARMQFMASKAKKTGRNEYSNFDYFRLEDIVPVAERICKDLGICVMFDSPAGQAVMHVYDCESSERYDITMEMKDVKITATNEMQAYGGAKTYARRYLWLDFLDIVEDDDFDSAQGRPMDKPAKGYTGKPTVPADKARKADSRPAEPIFNPKAVWKQVLLHFGYDMSKPKDDKDNADALKAAHGLFDPYAKTVDELTKDKGDAILERLQNMEKAVKTVPPEDFQDDSEDLMKGA